MSKKVTVYDQQDDQFLTGIPIRSKEGIFELVDDQHNRLGIFNDTDIVPDEVVEAIANDQQVSELPQCNCNIPGIFCPVHKYDRIKGAALAQDVYNNVEIAARKIMVHPVARAHDLHDVYVAEDAVERGIKALYLELPVEVATHFHNLFYKYKTLVHDALQK
jgi:hypothetical protein